MSSIDGAGEVAAAVLSVLSLFREFRETLNYINTLETRFLRADLETIGQLV